MSDTLIKKEYIIARYYFNSIFRDQANSTFVKDIEKEPFIDEGAFMYALGDFGIEKSGEDEFIRATFGKIKKRDYMKIYDKEKKKFKEGILDGKAEAMIDLIIHHKSHLIFIAKDWKIAPSLFKNKFKHIYQNNSSSVSDIEVDFISNEKDIYETIKKWGFVNSATFKNLRPSNPSSNDSFEDIEALIKETKSDRADFNFKKQINTTESRESLDLDSKLLRQALSLSAHGYGEATIKGVEGVIDVSVSTKKCIESIQLDFGEDGALEKITKKIKEIQEYDIEK